MEALSFTKRLSDGPALLNAWLTTPYHDVIHEIVQAGFPAVTFDMQHGLMGEDGLLSGLAACRAMGVPALVRLPLGGISLAPRALDAGACGIIAPMINSAHDAAALVEAVKFPPLGRRSWGPGRAYGADRLDRTDYLRQANDLSVVFAMIETADALGQLDAILAVDGIGGIFVGPNDLSVSLSQGRVIDVEYPDVVAALDILTAAATRHGKLPAIFANTPELAGAYARQGFRLISLGSDLGYLRRGAEIALNTAMEAARGS